MIVFTFANLNPDAAAQYLDLLQNGKIDDAYAATTAGFAARLRTQRPPTN